jgi:copper chaperone CopZ
MMHRLPALTVFALMILATSVSRAADPPQPLKYRVTGLFSPDREADLRETVKKLPDVKVVSIDFKHAEVTFSFDPSQLVPKGKPEQVLERLDNLIRTNSFSTFSVKPLSTTPKDKLTRIEIGVVGLDCKGCCLAAYEAVAKVEGVEQATASFKDGLVTASIDPAKTNRAALEAALKKARVELKSP